MNSFIKSSFVTSIAFVALPLQTSEASTVLLTADQLQAGATNTLQAMATNNPFNPPVNLSSSAGMLAVGFYNSIHGTASSAIGSSNAVWMSNSAALGQANVVGSPVSSANGNFNSMAIGRFNNVEAPDSLLVGYWNHTAFENNYDNFGGAERSLIVGSYNYSTGHDSVIVGKNNQISSPSDYFDMATCSALFGYGLISRYHNCTIVGQNNFGELVPYGQSLPLFIVGNGSSTSARSNALEVLTNGDLEVQGVVTCAPGGDIPMFTGN